MAAEHIPVEVACRVLDVSTSGYYAWRVRPPSARAIRHVWLTDLIVQVHQDSRGTYGALRVHAELRLGHGIMVGHNAIALLMRRAGLAGATGRPKWRHAKPDQIAADLVDRQFSRSGPNQLWVTDIERHEVLPNRVVVKGHRLWPVAAGR
jgi:transposase InsO family protein